VVNTFEHLTYIILKAVYLNVSYSESDHLTFRQKIFSNYRRSVIYPLNRDVYSTFPNYRRAYKYLGEINRFKPSNRYYFCSRQIYRMTNIWEINLIKTLRCFSCVAQAGITDWGGGAFKAPFFF